MFSYRHAFHAGSHADILKHLILIHLVEYLQEKPGALTIVDTHAGAGIYSLIDGFAAVSKEADEGIYRLAKFAQGNSLSPGITNYLKCIRAENSEDQITIYPGSPFILARLLRPQDRLKLFELHPKEIDILRHNMSELKQAKQIDIYAEDSFARLKGLVPPPSRRGLV
jgi:23S rRNA (adenine2030-N6)-methyltransferase